MGIAAPPGVPELQIDREIGLRIRFCEIGSIRSPSQTKEDQEGEQALAKGEPMRALVALSIWLAAPMVASAVPADKSLRPLLDAIRQVESGGRTGEIIGDGGRSLGPYQIQRPYWQDSNVPGRYGDVRNVEYAERVMIAYWQRYCPTALARRDYQTLARIHNGGPQGHRKAATLKYWKKVEKALAAQAHHSR